MSALFNFFKEVFIFLVSWILSVFVFVVLVDDIFHLDKNPLVTLTGIILQIVVAFYITNYISKKKSADSSKLSKATKKIKAQDKESVECVTGLLTEIEKSTDDNAFVKVEECLKDKSEEDQKRIVEAALMQYIDKALEDGLLDESEEKTIATIASKYGIDISNMEDLQKAKVLYSVIQGNVPEVEVDGTLPVLLKKDEKLLWAFSNVGLVKIVTKTKYVGGSDGISIRIAKGLYYRKSAFKGHRVSEKSKEMVDVGTLIITNKNIFFVGNEEKLKFQIDKLVSIEPYEDGIVLQKSGNAKPVTFIGIDGWFAYNLVTNLYRM